MLTYVSNMFLICSTKVDFDEDTFDDIGFRMILDQILWEIEKSYVQLDKSPIQGSELVPLVLSMQR